MPRPEHPRHSLEQQVSVAQIPYAKFRGSHCHLLFPQWLKSNFLYGSGFSSLMVTGSLAMAERPHCACFTAFRFRLTFSFICKSGKIAFISHPFIRRPKNGEMAFLSRRFAAFGKRKGNLRYALHLQLFGYRLHNTFELFSLGITVEHHELTKIILCWSALFET